VVPIYIDAGWRKILAQMGFVSPVVISLNDEHPASLLSSKVTVSLRTIAPPRNYKRKFET